MKYMLDTDTFSYLVNGIPQVLQRYAKVVEHEVGISVVSYGEVLFGIGKQQPGASKQKRIDYLLDQLPIALMDEDVARCYDKFVARWNSQANPSAPTTPG